MTRPRRRRIVPFTALQSVVLALLLAGCATAPRPVPVAAVAPAPAVASDFLIEAGQLDTWNALGQILVHADGVRYRGRAQMMGLYDIDYRGERMLLIAHGLVLDERIRVPTTQVRVTTAEGAPDVSDAAIALLHLAQDRLPAALRAIAERPAATPTPARRKRRQR